MSYNEEALLNNHELASVVAAILLSSSSNGGITVDNQIKRAVDSAFKIMQEAAAPGRPN
jgi:hypothetical protein